MAGYIGKSQGVTQVDGYTRSEADAEYVNDPNAALNISSSASADSATIDSSGNLLVGKTSAGAGTVGAEFNSNGILRVARSGAAPIEANRTTSDGTIIDIRKDNITVGSIGSRSGSHIYVALSPSSLANAGLTAGTASGSNTIFPTDSSGSTRDGSVDLGWSGGRFKNLYLSGGVYLGGTGSANYLDDYEVGTWTPTGNTVTYTGNDGIYTKIGNLVTATFTIGVPSNSSGSQLQISGLPFAEDGTDLQGQGITHAGSLGYCTFAKASSSRITVQGTTILFYDDGPSPLTEADASSSGVRGTITYKTAS